MKTNKLADQAFVVCLECGQHCELSEGQWYSSPAPYLNYHMDEADHERALFVHWCCARCGSMQVREVPLSLIHPKSEYTPE